MNELLLFSQNRPLRSAQVSEGWTPELVVEKFLAAARPSFYPLDRSADIFTWDPY